jgi:hypothetical protein
VSFPVQWDQEEQGTLYYTPSEKSKSKKTDRINPFFQAFFPTVDNLRNFFLTATTEVLSFFQQLREAP